MLIILTNLNYLQPNIRTFKQTCYAVSVGWLYQKTCTSKKVFDVQINSCFKNIIMESLYIKYVTDSIRKSSK